MAKINTPSYDWLIPRDHRIKVIQNLCENTSRDLPREYQSQQSMDQLLDAMGTAMDGTWTKVWDETNGRYDFTFMLNYKSQYLTFVARESGTISFNIWFSMGTDMITSISYSTDNGETWTTTNNVNDKEEHLSITVNVNEGDKVLWKGDAQQTGYFDEDGYGDYVGSFFSSTAEFDVQGNVMSLLYGDNFKGKDTLEYKGQFTCLFYDYNEDNECSVVNARNLSLPATTLEIGCYVCMFRDCTSLTTAPSILPASTLAVGCYSQMFYDCASLTAAPELPAITLANSCYSYMFSNCTSLSAITCLATNISATHCTLNWVKNVPAGGTFVKASSISWPTSTSGIPENWTVKNYTES